MKKKVLFVIDSLNSGGAEKSLISLLNAFNFDKYDVDLLLFSPRGLYLPQLPKEVKVLEVPNLFINMQEKINRIVKNKSFKELYIRLGISLSLRIPIYRKRMHKAQISWKWLSRGLENLKGSYDIAVAYSQGTPTYYVAEKVVAKKKLCWVNTDYKLAPYNKHYDEKFYKQYDHVIAVSDYNKNIFIKEMPIAKEKTVVIYDIISSKFIQSMACEPSCFNDNYDGIKILTIGRLVEVKGYDLAIESCFKLKQNGIKFKWYVIGEGNLKKKLLKKIYKLGLDNIFILLGTQSNPYNYIKNSDIYVQTSRYEGFGLAIAEARMLNKPIVSTNFDTVYNQIVDGKNGIIVDMNSEAIAKGITKLIKDRELKEDIVENLHKEKKGNVQEINKLYELIG
ncbi:glycosyltransferase [Oceanobacillus saliphilus]|uniref:glycosyltransferase n=1 Tax=Oceanobacillus saliphilus TaxID=2925834 RepID=UPI00201D507E|nr:glycosyltransferase [Oceanobacillus saliphilus]